MFSWKTFNEVEPQLMTSRYRILSRNPYVNTFTATGLHCSQGNTNHTATLTSTVHLRSSNRSHLEVLSFLLVCILHAFRKVTLTPVPPVGHACCTTSLLAAQLYTFIPLLGSTQTFVCVCVCVFWCACSCSCQSQEPGEIGPTTLRITRPGESGS